MTATQIIAGACGYGQAGATLVSTIANVVCGTGM